MILYIIKIIIIAYNTPPAGFFQDFCTQNSNYFAIFLFAAYARLRYTTPRQAGSIYLNSQRPYSRKRATSRLLCQKQALHIFTRRRRTSRSQRNADCTNRWRLWWEVLGSIGKVWEDLGALPPITATLCMAANAAKPLQHRG